MGEGHPERGGGDQECRGPVGPGAEELRLRQGEGRRRDSRFHGRSHLLNLRALDASGALPGGGPDMPSKKKMTGPGLFSTRFDMPVWAAPIENESATERLKRVTAADRIMRREGEDRHRIRLVEAKMVIVSVG